MAAQGNRCRDDIDEIAARRAGEVTGGIYLPPVRFAEPGTPAICFSHCSPTVAAATKITPVNGGFGGMACLAPLKIMSRC